VTANMDFTYALYEESPPPPEASCTMRDANGDFHPSLRQQEFTAKSSISIHAIDS
jgi:hypothetical protein